MEVGAWASTLVLARRVARTPFFFSRYNFERMQERGNTHFCFDCAGDVGFKLGPDGKPLDQLSEDGHDPMKGHSADHADAVIGGAHQYRYAVDWLQGELRGKDFPYVICVR